MAAWRVATDDWAGTHARAGTATPHCPELSDFASSTCLSIGCRRLRLPRMVCLPSARPVRVGTSLLLAKAVSHQGVLRQSRAERLQMALLVTAPRTPGLTPALRGRSRGRAARARSGAHPPVRALGQGVRQAASPRRQKHRGSRRQKQMVQVTPHLEQEGAAAKHPCHIQPASLFLLLVLRHIQPPG